MDVDTRSMQAITRASKLLELLGTATGPLSLAELTRESHLPRSTTHRILQALEVEGLVAKVRDGYVVGAQAALISGTARRRLLDPVGPVLRRVADDLGETVDLSVYSGGAVRCVDQAFPSGTTPIAGADDRLGSVASPYSTAAGKAITALLDAASARRLVGQPIALTPSTVADTDELNAQLCQVRSRSGLAWECDEFEVGRSSVAVGFRLGDDEPLALSISMPTERFRGCASGLVPALLDARREVLS